MKKILFIFSLVALLAAVPMLAEASAPSGETAVRVELLTDRSVYISGESIHFYTKLFNAGNLLPETESKILYCELIAPDGNKITTRKFMVSNSSARGCIEIPEELVSGFYYLRAYTKEMRNSGPATYTYVLLKIINPKRNEVLVNENVSGKMMLKIDADSVRITGDLFKIDINDTVFLAGETIKLSVQVSGIPDIPQFASLSVIPEVSLPVPAFSRETKLQPTVGDLYYPEDRGLSLTGKLTGDGGKPLRGKVVNLSIIGEGRDFMAVRTDTSGRFFFVLPEYYGKRDLFLCAQNTGLTDVKIWVDNDFCSMPVHLPTPVFSLTETERTSILNMAVNQQIETFFNTDTVAEDKQPLIDEEPFYGKPTLVLNLDQYVQLPALEEYFNELPGLVKVRKRSGGKYFKVIGDYDLSFYDPLVLVDWVAVDEIDRVLAVAPRNVARIEIVNQMYIKGGQTYGGIISIISKKGDFAGIDLPSTGIFINFRFLAKDDCAQPTSKEGKHLTDSKNTLLWEPEISFSEKATHNYTIQAPFTPGKYSVVVEGVMGNGEPFRQTRVFEVKSSK